MTVFPYSDAMMTYSVQTHRYTLTPYAVRQILNVDLEAVLNPAGALDKSVIANALLSNVSREIYAYIYACGLDNSLQEYLAAKHPNARGIILDAMLAQVEYMVLNGSLYQVSGVDIRKGIVMDQRALRKVQIAPMAQDVLARPLGPDMPSLVYRGAINALQLYAKRLPAYDEEDY
ncbi:MAG: hypothetical protein IJY71_07065 [Clostridia bacterium]|nr:hypothetical protein [Clostridia bacterium]